MTTLQLCLVALGSITGGMVISRLLKGAKTTPDQKRKND